VSTGRDEDEEVAGEVSQRQTVDDVLNSPVVEVPRPRDISKHLPSVHTHFACFGRAVSQLLHECDKSFDQSITPTTENRSCQAQKAARYATTLKRCANRRALFLPF